MQLALIVQLSIALLAGELAGVLPMDAWTSAGIALAAPLAVLCIGWLLGRAALEGMDRRSTKATDRLFAFNARAHWLVSGFLLIAACGSLHPELAFRIGNAGVVCFLFACGIIASLAVYANAWPVERRIRESTIMRQLDAGGSVHEVPSRAAYIAAQARAGLLPLVVPLVVPLLMSELAFTLANAYAPEHAELWRFFGAILGATILFLLVPVIVPLLLGLRRLENGDLRDDLERLARDARIGVSEIWVWPTDGLVANAAVMGLFRGLRCVMLSDAILECMPRTQVRAVMAHELGHVARRHLPWMIVVVLACWTIAGAAAHPIAEAVYQRLAVGMHESQQHAIAQISGLVRDGTVLLVGLSAFGFASRRIERQADTYAVQLLSAREGRDEATAESVDAMVGALGSVAFLNHAPKSRPSWRHGSINWRQEYLRSLVGQPHGALPIDRLVAWIRWSALLVLVVTVVLGSDL